MSDSSKILITGGAGFIGCNLVEYLVRKTDWQIIVLDNFSTGSLENLKQIDNFSVDRIKIIQGDIRKLEDIQGAIGGCQFIINLAAQTSVIKSQQDPLTDAQINTTGVINLLEAARQANVKRFVQASTTACLGEQSVPVNEEIVPAPISPYGASKLAAEAYLRAYAESFGLSTFVLRFANAYGPYSNLTSGAISLFIQKILKQAAVSIYGDGRQTRDFIFVGDICRAIYISLKKETDSAASLYQIGSDQETSVNTLFELIKESCRENGIDVKEPAQQSLRPGEIINSCSDSRKAKQELGFEPKVDLAQGISRTLDWFRLNQ